MNSSNRCKALATVNSQFIRKMSAVVRKLRDKKLKSHQQQRLKRFVPQLRQMANSKVSIKKKRRLLSQRGGALASILLPLATTLLPSLMGSIFGKRS